MEQALFWVRFVSLAIDKTPCLHGNCCRCRFLSQIDVWCLFLSVHFCVFLLFIEFNSMSIRWGGWVVGRGSKWSLCVFLFPPFVVEIFFHFCGFYWVFFLLYINDIYKSSSLFAFCLFADDTSIILANNNLKELETLVNRELGNVNEWLKANKLSLNIKKIKLCNLSSPAKEYALHT